MRTVHEIDGDRLGTVLRVFHRSGSRSWVHPLGERASLLPCECRERPKDSQDQGGASDGSPSLSEPSRGVSA